MDQASDGRGSKNAPAHSAGALKEAASEDRLLPLVEAEIIPRLIMAHQDQRLQAPNAPEILARDVMAFSRALMENRMTDATDIVADLCSQGISMDRVYLNLFTPSARYLGELWEADLCTFSEVTLCLWRLQTLLYELSPAFHANAKAIRPGPDSERRILMATMPGQQHTFGLSMLSEFFRREGWVVLSIPSPKPGELQDSLSGNWFDVLALSVSTDNELPELGKSIRSARKTSRNPRLSVMVGGPLFIREPSLAATVGADGCSSDADAALALAIQLIQQQQDVRMN
jgi:methanogenic corrinoid protein MtbC1